MRWKRGFFRLWLVLTTALFLGVGIGYPYFEVYKFDPYYSELRTEIRAGIVDPMCQDYAVKPLKELQKPDAIDRMFFGRENCSSLYLGRQLADSPTLPYTIEAYDYYRAANKRNDFFIGAAFLGTLVILGSAIVYMIGLVISWIARGFAE